jgi:hypothetical protein
VFFGEIEQNHPDLLSFESSDDKRQLVKAMADRSGVDQGLIRARRAKNNSAA